MIEEVAEVGFDVERIGERPPAGGGHDAVLRA
jgi:hypothetical protein